MSNQKHILIIAGEASGDLNAANLAKALKEINPALRICGIGGEQMRAAGVEIYYDIKGLSVLGLFDVLRKLPRFFALKDFILQKINAQKPDAIILVDFSGFNLRLAKAINHKLPTIYYISPQVWASRQGRIKTIKKYISRMIVIFKFEEEFYKRHGIDVDFVGYPLLDTIRPTMEKKEFCEKFNLSEFKHTIALLPGSRKSEIVNILPVMLESARYIQQNMKGIQFVIAKSANVDLEIYNHQIKGLGLDLKIVEGKTYDCLNIADFCMVASGTATLETAIMQKPFVVIYKMGLLNYLLYRPQVKVPYIGMINIVAGKKIIPEFIQFQANPKKISQLILQTLNDPSRMQQIKNDLAQLKASLGENGASLRAARIVLGLIKNS